MDHSFDKLKRSPVWAIILGILSLLMEFFAQLSGAGKSNTGESARFAKPAKKRFDARSVVLFYSANLDALDELKGRPPACSGERREGSLLETVALVIVSSLALMIGSLQVRVSLLKIVALVVNGSQVTVKKHGEGESSSGPAGGSGAGNAGGSRGGGGDENGRIGHGIGEGRCCGIGGGRQRRGNGDGDDNDGGHMVGNVENGGNPRPEETENIFLTIILQSIAIILAIDDAQLSTTGRVIRSFSMIINLLGFICCAAVHRQPHTNPRVARLLNPRIARILSRIGSALSVLGFISMMAIGITLPLYLRWIIGLTFLVLLAIFMVDIH